MHRGIWEEEKHEDLLSHTLEYQELLGIKSARMQMLQRNPVLIPLELLLFPALSLWIWAEKLLYYVQAQIVLSDSV